MKNKIIIIGIGFIVIATLIIFNFFGQNTVSETKDRPKMPIVSIPETKDRQKMQIVSIDELVSQPNLYKGIIAVTGTVTKSTISKSFFILGCDDACIMLPVEFNKQLPKSETKITAIGELAQTKEGKYFFKATDIKNEE